MHIPTCPFWVASNWLNVILHYPLPAMHSLLVTLYVTEYTIINNPDLHTLIPSIKGTY